MVGRVHAGGFETSKLCFFSTRNTLHGCLVWPDLPATLDFVAGLGLDAAFDYALAGAV